MQIINSKPTKVDILLSKSRDLSPYRFDIHNNIAYIWKRTPNDNVKLVWITSLQWNSILSPLKKMEVVSEFGLNKYAILKWHKWSFHIIDIFWNITEIPLDNISQAIVSWDNLLVKFTTDEFWLINMFNLNLLANGTIWDSWKHINIDDVVDKSLSYEDTIKFKIESDWKWSFFFLSKKLNEHFELRNMCDLIKIDSNWDAKCILKNRYFQENKIIISENKIFYAEFGHPDWLLVNNTLHFIDLETEKTKWPYEFNFWNSVPTFKNWLAKLWWFQHNTDVINSEWEIIYEENKDLGNWSRYNQINWEYILYKDEEAKACTVYNKLWKIVWTIKLESNNVLLPELTVLDDVLIVDRILCDYNNWEDKIVAYDLSQDRWYDTTNTELVALPGFYKKITDIAWRNREIEVIDWKIIAKFQYNTKTVIIDWDTVISSCKWIWKQIEMDWKTYFLKSGNAATIFTDNNLVEMKNISTDKVDINWKVYNKGILKLN
jgi:hypothetical protein